MNRAYSLLEIKSVDESARKIRGIASTPSPDRQGDIIEPSGAKFPKEIPLLLHHRKETPVGVARLKKSADGIDFEAELPIIDDPGPVKDEVDRAWVSIIHKLIKGVSIGFRVIDDAVELVKETGGLRFLKTEILELSLVTVPANADASLSLVKSLDAPYLAASGHHSPGDSGLLPVVRAEKAAKAMTTAEQISSFENKRAANVAAMNALMLKSEGSTLDDGQREEYTTLEREVESIDEHLPRLRKLEEFNKKNATAITQTATSGSQASSDTRGGGNTIVQVKSVLPKGTAFTRYVMAMAGAQGDSMRALERAKGWADTTPEVELMVKGAIAAGTTTTSGFAAELAVQQPQNEFIELLRPKTLLGRIPNLRRVPFNVSVPAQTAGGTYAWVGQGKPKPLTSMTTATVTLAINKIAGIIVLTEELVKISSPSAEGLVRDEMIAGITKFMDEQFIDPSVAASGTVSPASITNGTTPVTSAGTSADNALTDIKAVMTAFVTANLSLANAVWIMSEANMFALGVAVNALGAPLFPGMNGPNPTLFGVPVVATQSAGTTVALVDAQGILVADDGGVSIDVSREASLQMDSAPTDPVDASTVLVSMFQQNMVALRAERFVTWKRARTASVKYVAQTYV